MIAKVGRINIPFGRKVKLQNDVGVNIIIEDKHTNKEILNYTFGDESEYGCDFGGRAEIYIEFFKCKPRKPKELTIEELCDILGYDVKIIN